MFILIILALLASVALDIMTGHYTLAFYIVGAFLWYAHRSGALTSAFQRRVQASSAESERTAEETA